MSILSRLLARHAEPDDGPVPRLNLVVGLNRVDQIVANGWRTDINLPTDEAAEQIDRKCADVIRLLSDGCRIAPHHVEYYSALKCFRLEHLLNRVITHCVAGFKFGDVSPNRFEDVAGVSPEARAFVADERRRRRDLAGPPGGAAQDGLFADLARVLSVEELTELKERFGQERARPARIAVIGQSGVGKTTTVNALFSVNWTTSPVEVGTHTPQSQSVPLPSGGRIRVTDLPGYGRSIAEDAAYEDMYRAEVTDCDLVLLVVQADRGDFADDQEMINKIVRWRADAATHTAQGDPRG